MKKILSVILTVVMIASMFASVVVVNAADKLTITVDSIEGEAGAEVKVNVKLTNNTGISSIKMELNYGDLQFVKATFPIYDVDDESAMRQSNNKPDDKKVILNWLTANEKVTGDATYATVTFKVPADAAKGTKYALTAVITQSNVFVNEGGKQVDVPFEFVEGEVKVPGEVEIVDTYVGHSLDSMLASGKESKKLDTVELKKGDTMTILGWAVFTDLLKEMVYTIDGEEHACEDVYRDRNDASPQYGKHAGFGLDNNFMDLLGVDSLDLGTYAITIIARANGGFEKVIKTFTLKVVEELTPEDPGEPEFVHTVFDAGKVDNNTLVNAGGWTGGNYPITRFGYIVDGGAPVFAGVSLTELPDSDPVKAPQNAGKYGVRFSAYFDLKDAGLAPGKHTVQLVAEFADDAKTVLPLGNVASVVQNSFEVTIEGAAPVELSLMNVSFDGLYYNGSLILPEGGVDKIVGLPENRETLDFVKGDVTEIAVRGWVRVSEDIGDIAGFAYSIDGGEIVSGEFVEDRAAELANANFPGAQGFTVKVPVADLEAGEHTIEVYVITANGQQIKIVKDRSTAEAQVINPVGVTFTVSDPTVTEPEVTEPDVTEPDTTEPDTTEPTENPDNPKTSDVAVIALASVAAVALAGAFIGKKALKK